MMTMIRRPSEEGNIDAGSLRNLKKLVAEGEGLHLEFKRKISQPEKIVRELVAFANTGGGTLLIGVDDDQTIPGIKYPDEEIFLIQDCINKTCKPTIVYHASIICLDLHRFVVRVDVPPGTKRLHYMVHKNGKRECVVRSADKSIKASREMQEIIQRAKKNKNVQVTIGDDEIELFNFLDIHKSIRLEQFQQLRSISRFKASRKLILLVLANVLRIRPTDRGDLYERI